MGKYYTSQNNPSYCMYLRKYIGLTVFGIGRTLSEYSGCFYLHTLTDWESVHLQTSGQPSSHSVLYTWWNLFPKKKKEYKKFQEQVMVDQYEQLLGNFNDNWNNFIHTFTLLKIDTYI